MTDTPDRSGSLARRLYDAAGDRAAMVFPAPEPTTLTGNRRAIGLGVLVVAGTLIALWRTPPQLWNTLWAEDGGVFLTGVLTGDPLVVFEPFAGYLHLVPRALIALCALFPLAVVPTVVTVAAALVTALSAVAVFVFLETRIRLLPLRLAAWLAALAIPVAGGEVANNLANLHWFLMVAAVCALIVPSRGRAFATLQCVVVGAAMASDPLTMLFLPLVVIRWVFLRSGRDRAVAYTFAGAAVFQLAVTFIGLFVVGSRSFERAVPPLTELADFYTFRVALNALLGVTAVMRDGPTLGSTIPGLIVAVIIVVLLAAAWRDRRRRYAVLALGMTSVVFFGSVFALQWRSLAGSGALGLPYGQRYAVVSTMLLLLAILVAVDAVIRTWRPTAALVAATVVLAGVAIPSAVDYRWSTLREGASSWTAGLEAARAECEASPARQSIRVPIAPTWVDTLVPCELLREGPGSG